MQGARVREHKYKTAFSVGKKLLLDDETPKNMYKETFQARISDEQDLRWEKTAIKGGRRRQNGRSHQWEFQFQHHRLTSAGHNRPDSRIKQQRFCFPAARSRRFSAHAAQDHTGQTQHQTSDCRNESDYEQMVWQRNAFFFRQTTEKIHAGARRAVSDPLLPSSGTRWIVPFKRQRL